MKLAPLRAFALAGALAAPALAVASVASGCDKSDAPSASTRTAGRSEAVVATGNMPTAAPAPAPAPHPAAPSGPRKICEGETVARTLPKMALARAQVPGVPPLDDKIPTGTGRWTWLNFFAAWCGPCKEEIPRLRTWEKKLAQAGTRVDLVFLSVDDDERQLAKFLEAQPPSGVRAALWIKENVREGWLGSMKMKNPPELPEHALIDPTGRVRCVIEGALEDTDYAPFAAYLAK
ncbi:TlpA family protein disulfide reductase [Pendulispora albinea]|uniref:TlpA family protein disulfide reductase n=1 Tax=Pendulispora albinea TaxID=2741071 RepID=A0ABZ2LQ13_9BACT